MKNKKRTLIGTIIVIVLSMIALLIYVRREKIVESALRKEFSRFEEKTKGKFTFQKLKIDGLSIITFHGMTLISPENDTLLYVEMLKMRLSPVFLLHGEVKVTGTEAQGVCLNITHKKEGKNYQFLIQGREKNNKKEEKVVQKTDKLAQIYGLITKKSPKEIRLNGWKTTLTTDSIQLSIYMPEATLEERKFNAIMHIDEEYGDGGKEHINDSIKREKEKNYYLLEGTLGKKPSDFTDFQFYALQDSITFAYIKKKFDTDIAFDTLKMSISVDKDKGKVKIEGRATMFKSQLYNKKICSEEIRCRQFSVDFKSFVSANHIEIDSSSTLKINRFSLHPYLDWQTEDTVQKVEFNLIRRDFEAQDLFDAIPDGLCKNLKGIKTEGKLSYQFHFRAESNQIDSLEFSSSLTPNQFRIIEFGKTDFRRVNAPFLYHYYEKNTLVDTFTIGESNPNYVKIEDVSPYLTHSILYSEDGHFFHHKGFLEFALRESIIKNLKTKKFARGGSTISMQLVKNLWLSREKTLARKLEEAMIVWLIENNRLLSKERMFEIYLNIIEWGPHIYGAKQAAQYFFSKSPKELTIAEAIYMASIIPKPKKFMWYFDDKQNLKPFLEGYYNLISSKLLRHEIITEQDTATLVPNVRLTGPAKALLKGKATDSTEINSEDELFNDDDEDIFSQDLE